MDSHLNSNFEIKHLSADQLDNVYDLFCESFPNLLSSKKSFEDFWNEKSFHVIGAFTEQNLASFMVYQDCVDSIDIVYICVRQIYRSQGLGKSLIDSVAKEDNFSVRKIFAEVAVDNDRAIRFYKSIGFLQVGMRKNYETRRDGTISDSYLFVLELDPRLVGK